MVALSFFKIFLYTIHICLDENIENTKLIIGCPKCPLFMYMSCMHQLHPYLAQDPPPTAWVSVTFLSDSQSHNGAESAL